MLPGVDGGRGGGALKPEGYDRVAREQLGNAMDALEGPGPIKKRLYRAWLRGLHVVITERLSDRVRQQIEEALTWVPPGPEEADEDEGSVIATLKVMSEAEALALAARVEALYDSFDPP